MFIVNLISFLLVLGLVILIHELGHFWFAKRAGILCHEFAIGMGPIVYKKQKGETLYTIRAFPIGGFVMMAGEEISDAMIKTGDSVKLKRDGGGLIEAIILHTDHQDYQHLPLETVESFSLSGKDGAPLTLNNDFVAKDALYILKDKTMMLSTYDRSFESKTLWQRFTTIFAGPMMNFILAFVIFTLVAMLAGFPVTDSNELGAVSDSLPAGEVLQVGDRIVAVNGTPTESWDDFSAQMQQLLGVRNVVITVERDGSRLDYTLNPRLFFYSVGFNSHPEATTDLRIGPVVSGTLAAQAGIQENDVIVAIDGLTMTSWQHVTQLMQEEAATRTFTLNRGGSTVEVTIEPFEAQLLSAQGVRAVESMIGVSPTSEFRFLPSFAQGGLSVVGAGTMIFDTLRLLVNSSQVGVGDLAGPIGIFTITSQARAQGIVVLLNWVGLLSVNLGILNLLPIPALDGGRIVFLGYEAVTRRKVNKRIENMLHLMMFFILISLFVFVAFNDVIRLFN